MKFKDMRKARKEAIEYEQNLEREQQRRATYYSHLLGDICRFKICILATYPSEPGKPVLSSERINSFIHMRADIGYDLDRLAEHGVEVPQKIRDTVNNTSLENFTCLEDCLEYFKKLEAALRTLILYY